jgi:Phasin protein
MAARATRSTARKPARRKTRARAASAPKTASAAPKIADMFKVPDPAQFAKYAKTLTPEQAFEMYRANAKLALEVIENALEETAKVRKLQYEGEERARSMQRKTARSAAEAGDVQSLMAVGQNAAQEAVEQSIQYWGQMFDLIVEMQKRLFALMESKAAGLPGAREAQAAMKMLPDLAKMQNVVSAMQGLMSTSTGAFEQMQKVMGDVARMSGLRR